MDCNTWEKLTLCGVFSLLVCFLLLEEFLLDPHMLKATSGLGDGVCVVGVGLSASRDRGTYSPWSSPLDSSEKADHCSWSRPA